MGSGAFKHGSRTGGFDITERNFGLFEYYSTTCHEIGPVSEWKTTGQVNPIGMAATIAATVFMSAVCLREAKSIKNNRRDAENAERI